MRRLKPIFHCNAKPFALGPGIGLDTQCHNPALPIPTCWYLKTRKFALPPTPNLKFALPPTPNPDASRWNIGCVVYQNAKFSRWQCTFHFFGVDFICVWWPTQTQFPVEYGLTSHGIYLIKHVNMFSICSWYLKAQQIAPKNGRPYNQLAILALYTVSTRIAFDSQC